MLYIKYCISYFNDIQKSKIFKGLNIGVTNNMSQTADLKKNQYFIWT